MVAKKEKRGHQEPGKNQGTGLPSRVERPVVVAKTGATATNQADPSREQESPAVIAKTGAGCTNQSNQSHEQEMRRSSMTAEGMSAERARDDYRGMARSWKDGYLQGLNVCLQWQEENERLIKNSVKQGLSGTHQFLTWWKGLIEDQAQRQVDAQQRQTNGTNPILGFTKQSTDAVLATVEPILKNSEAVVESSFGYYEHAVATPSRKYVRDINKQVLDAVIPS
jgi:hypothetical protein